MAKFTLGDMKEKVYKLIEEAILNEQPEEGDPRQYTDDPDLLYKFYTVADTILHEVFKVKPKVRIEEDVEFVEGEDFILSDELDRFYKLEKIKGIKFSKLGDVITPKETGTGTIYYYEYPKPINVDTANDYKYDEYITRDMIDCMSFGIAGDILKSDISNDYGERYFARYQSMLSSLMGDFDRGTITVTKGVKI